MRTQRRKAKRRRKRRQRRRTYKRRRRTRRRRRRRRGRMTRRRRRGGASAVGALKSLLMKGKGRNTRGGKRSTQLPITVICDSADAAGDAACEVLGLGPEDPLADVCAYEATTHIAKFCKRFISKHEPSAVKEILSNPMSIIKKLTGKKKGASVLSPMAAKSNIGVEI